MKAISAVDICNLALSQLGDKRVTTIEAPATATEQICALHYDTTRQSLFRKHLWNFAKKRVVLTRLNTAPSFDYTDQYQLPNDYMRLIKVSSTDDTRFDHRDYDVEEGKLLLNANGATTVNLVYVFDQTVVAKWDTLFKTLCYLTLAKVICYDITRKATLKEALMAEIERMEANVKAIDGQERPPRRVERSRFVESRRQLSNYAKTYVDVEGF